MIRALRLGAASTGAVLVIAMMGFAGCTGGAGPTVPPGAAVAIAQLDATMIARTWPVGLATQAEQDKLTAVSEGWISLLLKRNYQAATKQLGAVGGLAGARAHSDASALYRQAAMVSAYSFIGTYADNPQETDPVGVHHLLCVAYVLTGDLVKAREESAKMDAFPDDPTTKWHAPWKAWLAQANPVWPPDLSSLPLGLPALTGGEWPELPAMPDYVLPELAGSSASVEMADPGGLIALAMWHDQVAHQLAGDQGAAVDTYLARYHFPIEPDVAGTLLPYELVVGSDYLVPEDGAFIADLVGAKGGAAVDEWKGKSLLAAIAARSRAPDGTFSAELAGNLAGELRLEVQAAEKAKNGGEENGAHRQFADMAQAGVLRSLAFVPEVEVRRNSEESGKLRILAMEMADTKDATACPAGLLSLAAWDAGNRYTMRGSDIIHTAIRRYPSVEASRYALDVLALRVSREAPRVEPNQ